MITYSYSEYSPEDDNQFSIDRLMSILSEMIMKYDISLEESLKLLIDQSRHLRSHTLVPDIYLVNS